MKNLTILLFAFSLLFSINLSAQSLNSAGKAFNKGISLAEEAKIPDAIESYEKCIRICTELGEEGNELKGKAEAQIMNIYMDKGLEAFNAKNYDGALTNFMLAADYAQNSNDIESVEKTNKYIATCYTGKGNALYKNKKYKDALNNFTTALEYNSSYAMAYYGMAICYSKQEEGVAMEEAVANVVKFGEDSKIVEKATKLAATYYVNQCVLAIKAENYRIANMMAQKSLEYDDQSQKTYYYKTLANNGMGNFDEAIKDAMSGIKIGGEETSDLYFELGRSYAGKGDNTKACEYYAKVSSGPNLDAANYQRQSVLKCD
jgi:tetratricopeptide (TPR) repeat protein